VTDRPARRSWWRKKRWAAALLLWLILIPVLYVLSMGPAVYLFCNGWIGKEAYEAYATPTFHVVRRVPDDVGLAFGRYIGWWARLGDGGR
jgi:hypothetical protein